ncbi:IS21-like element helper ATPase IstB [Thermobrachium celere]|uniref:Mobile element protein n=1 Tax=Thermobrachium celere DSM 8682 TaxID=941824 RepID=R7RRG5_9CLOT|nr:IS21-like element helper ATPase IstB [Thermobrachium celere]CDF58634.1 Mobile element protein [Thermobrachium celere DSM 8682]
MNNYIKLLNNLDELGLINIKNNIDTYLNLINSGEKSVIDALYELSNLELKSKQEKAILACVKTANFPFLKEIDDFEFEFQPSINKQQILDLKSLRFVENNENILFVGTPGVGKTHLATSLGIECAKHRYSTYFIHFQELMAQLKKALAENRLEARLKHFSKYKVLIIDEVGYLPIDIDTANIFFQLISKRYEKHSTIITTNMPFSSWGEVFGSATIMKIFCL